MIAGRIGTRKQWYTVDNKIVRPGDLVMRDMFKGVNWLAAWARGKGGGSLGEFRRFCEERVLELDLNGIRLPCEVDLWDTGFWIEPENETGIVNLHAKAGSGFKLSQIQRKIIRKTVLFGREYSTPDQPFIIEMPWCWTIKHPKEVLVTGTRFIPGAARRLYAGSPDRVDWDSGLRVAAPERWEFRDPRAKGLRGEAAEKAVSEWNEHYLANIAKYLRLLRDVGDGEGASRVDPGPIPILNEAANEYETLGGARWDADQLGNIFQRWRHRDTPTEEGGKNFELLGISTGGPIRWDAKKNPPGPVAHGYEPFEVNKDTLKRPSDIRIHPPRDVEIPWWEIGKWIDYSEYPKVPIFVNEPILLMPTKAYDSPGHKWKWLGTKRHDKYFQMLDDLINRHVYVTIHDGGNDEGGLHGGGMSANWIPGEGIAGGDRPGVIDARIREWAGGVTPPPPPPPPEWKTVYEEEDVQLRRKEVS